jgi:hypothetical protein
MSQFKDLKGTGGWLGYLIVSLCFLHPLVSGYRAVQNFAAAERNTASLAALDSWVSYKQAVWGVLIVVSTIRFIAGLALFLSRRHSAVRLAIVVLWLCPLISTLSDALLRYYYFGQGADAASVVSQLLVGWFWAGVWSAYLLRSVRVHNTYVVHPNNSFKPKPLRGSA